jgi:hypothetical protein
MSGYAAGVLVVVSLSGCSPLPNLGLVPTNSPSAASASADDGAPTVASVLALPTGTVIDKAQIQALANDGTRGVGFYHLANGDVVLVHSDQPLPANVTSDISAKAKTINPAVSGDLYAERGMAIQMNALNFVNGIKSQTGKSNVCAVLPTVYNDVYSPTVSPGWGAYGCPFVSYHVAGLTVKVIFTSTSKDATIAKAKELMASQPADWYFVVP